MYIAGYKLNNGDMAGLTNLQKLAVIIMKKERDKYYGENKAILTTGGYTLWCLIVLMYL